MARVVVIPARYASQRFPGKLLQDRSGWPLIRHVVERCRQVPGVDQVIVAADGPRIANAVRNFGGVSIETDPELASGTDRVAAAVAELGVDATDGIVNVQGDEPQIDPDHIRTLFELLEQGAAPVATLATPRFDEEGFRNPNRVKVVLTPDGRALYFSRAGIPHFREGARFLGEGQVLEGEGQVPDVGPAGADTDPGDSWLCHVGIYGFRADVLRRFTVTPPSRLERIERLEQLRFLEMGLPIQVGVVKEAAEGIDTPEDYERWLAQISG